MPLVRENNVPVSRQDRDDARGGRDVPTDSCGDRRFNRGDRGNLTHSAVGTRGSSGMGVGVETSIGGRKVEQPSLPSGCDDGAAPWLEGIPSHHHSTLPDTSVEAYQQWVLQQQQQYGLWKQQQQQGFS